MEWITDPTNWYEILDVHPHASEQEIREAYLRCKSTYHRTNLALYTVVTPEQREQILQKIEQAYQVLSDLEKRRDYDRFNGLIVSADQLTSPSEKQDPVVSIDRLPPMESHLDMNSMLIPPSTDYLFQAEEAPLFQGTQVLSSEQREPSDSESKTMSTPPLSIEHKQSFEPSLTLSLDSQWQQKIENEIEWRGFFLRKLREIHKISLEEMMGITKISKRYLLAIEEEVFEKLPAPVFVRGFVTQIAKVLRLPHEKVAKAYLDRYCKKRVL